MCEIGRRPRGRRPIVDSARPGGGCVPGTTGSPGTPAHGLGIVGRLVGQRVHDDPRPPRIVVPRLAAEGRQRDLRVAQDLVQERNVEVRVRCGTRCSGSVCCSFSASALRCPLVSVLPRSSPVGMLLEAELVEVPVGGIPVAAVVGERVVHHRVAIVVQQAGAIAGERAVDRTAGARRAVVRVGDRRRDPRRCC